ncbi:unnamed protein product [Clonostachys rhizophaga]|uniref:Uncharacterized protein n=1 Tax=Clonostachys rhizophaga TaxID=160324 RepID=A0A9N9YCV3_9HYPO|nr:unnamed protein product [Clonostachys rhizophaga]
MTMLSSGFRCTCLATFACSEERDGHFKEEQTKQLQQRQLVFDLQQHLQQSLSHSKAEENDVLRVPEPMSQYESLAKHKDRDGYHCPRDDCFVKPAEKLTGFRAHYGTHVKLKRPCPICVPSWISGTSIEWIRHVRRHETESEIDARFIRDKCEELFRGIDEELLLVHPRPKSLRSERAPQKRTQEAAGISVDQSISQKPKLMNAVNNHTEEAAHEKGEILRQQAARPSSNVCPTMNNADTQNISMHFGTATLTNTIVEPWQESMSTNEPEVSVRSGGMDSYLLHMQDAPAIYDAMNYFMSGSGI